LTRSITLDGAAAATGNSNTASSSANELADVLRSAFRLDEDVVAVHFPPSNTVRYPLLTTLHYTTFQTAGTQLISALFTLGMVHHDGYGVGFMIDISIKISSEPSMVVYIRNLFVGIAVIRYTICVSTC
jgi:hypothetical protein